MEARGREAAWATGCRERHARRSKEQQGRLAAFKGLELPLSYTCFGTLGVNLVSLDPQGQALSRKEFIQLQDAIWSLGCQVEVQALHPALTLLALEVRHPELKPRATSTAFTFEPK